MNTSSSRTGEMQELLRKEEESKKELLNLFKELGYGLE